MRAFLALVEADRLELREADLARLAPPLLSALQSAGIVREGDPGMAELSPSDLGRTLRKLYGVTSHGLALPSALDERPVLLGWTGEGAARREVLFVSNPSRGLSWALRRPFRCLVLVPTADVLNAAMRRRHGPGSLVEVEALERALAVRGGRLVRQRGTKAASDASASSNEGDAIPRLEPGARHERDGASLLAGAERWNQVRLCLVHYAMIRVDLPGRSVRCVAADLGMVHARSRKPTVSWQVLVALCEDGGTFKTTRFGGIAATKKIISRLRASLQDLFDIADSPFERYSKAAGWKAKFTARGSLPEDLVGGGSRDPRQVAFGDISEGAVDDEVDFSEDDPSA